MGGPARQSRKARSSSDSDSYCRPGRGHALRHPQIQPAAGVSAGGARRGGTDYPEEIDQREAARQEDLQGRPSSPSTRMTPGISTMPCMSKRRKPAGGSASTSPMSRTTSAPARHLDREARKRGNSTYLADRVIPMLPERLSNGVCSLKPGVDPVDLFRLPRIYQSRPQSGAMRFARTVIRSAGALQFIARTPLAMLEGARRLCFAAAPGHEERRRPADSANIASGPPAFRWIAPHRGSDPGGVATGLRPPGSTASPPARWIWTFRK